MYDKVIGALEISGVIVSIAVILGLAVIPAYESHEDEISEKATKKIYVDDYTYDGDDSTLTYSEAVKTYLDGDTLRTAMFLTENGSVVKVTNLDKVVSTDEKKPYVTYKVYPKGSKWHDDGEQYGRATLHLPKSMHQKVSTVSNAD